MRISPLNLHTISYKNSSISSANVKSTDAKINSDYVPVFYGVLLSNSLKVGDKQKIENLIDDYAVDNHNIKLLGKGTCGTAYKIDFPNKTPFVVKVLSDDAVTNYGGGNLKKEAEILRQIPNDCKRTQQLIDYFETDKREYLVSSLIKGEPLSKLKTLNKSQLNNITDELFKYDRYGLMFYDLNPNNIFVDGNNVGFIDFEFVENKAPRKYNFESLNDAHHISRNLYFPQKSNINSFENRSLGGILLGLNENQGNKLVKDYLKSLSKYHFKMSEFLGNGSAKISPKAIEYEKTLAKLFEEPSDEIVEIEKNLIELRYITLNYHLYIHRKNAGKLLAGDEEMYGDFDKYIEKMQHKTLKTLQKIEEFSNKNDDKDIKNYCKVNRIFVENFIRKNANKSYYEVRKNINVTQNLDFDVRNIISNFDNYNQNDLEKILTAFYVKSNRIKERYRESENINEFCNNMEFILENTTSFLNEI